MTDADTSGYSVFFWWLCGIFLLVTALLISARMGIYQEVLYKRHGKHSREALYVTVSQIQILMSFDLKCSENSLNFFLFDSFFSAFIATACIFTAI